jgi:hypothetical protein
MSATIGRTRSPGPNVRSSHSSGHEGATEVGRGTGVRYFRFNPAVGLWRSQLMRLGRALASDRPNAIDDTEAAIAGALDAGVVDPAASSDRVRFGFTLSLLRDLARAGGTIRVVDSELFVAWPDWESVDGRASTRVALQSILPPFVLSPAEVRTAQGAFWGSQEPATVLELMRSGEFWLEPAEARHPSGATYGDLFSLALKYWSMPYRGREGRLRKRNDMSRGRQGVFESCRGLVDPGDTEEGEPSAVDPVSPSLRWVTYGQGRPAAILSSICLEDY